MAVDNFDYAAGALPSPWGVFSGDALLSADGSGNAYNPTPWNTYGALRTDWATDSAIIRISPLSGAAGNAYVYFAVRATSSTRGYYMRVSFNSATTIGTIAVWGPSGYIAQANLSPAASIAADFVDASLNYDPVTRAVTGTLSASDGSILATCSGTVSNTEISGNVGVEINNYGSTPGVVIDAISDGAALGGGSAGNTGELNESPTSGDSFSVTVNSSVYISDAVSAAGLLSAIASAVASTSGYAAAVDGTDSAPSATVSWSAPATGNATTDAAVTANAAMLEAVSAGESWASAVLALADLSEAGAAGEQIDAASSTAFAAAISANTASSSAFAMAVTSLAQVTGTATPAEALIALVIATAEMSGVINATGQFSAGSSLAAHRILSESAYPGDAVGAVGKIVASFSSSINPGSAIILSGQASVSWESAANAISAFSASTAGAASYLLAAVQISTLLNASVEIEPLLVVSVEVQPT